MNRISSAGVSRRTFIRSTGAASMSLALGGLGSIRSANARPTDRLRVGVVGCGSRGTGAARDCVVSAENVEIYAMGDLFPDRLEQSIRYLGDHIGNALNVAPDRAFAGFDAYDKVLDADIDLVILATPPGFRPTHFEAAIHRGRHVFLEKPVAVDPDGVRSVIATGEVADEKGLSVVAGTIYRRQPSFVEAVRRLQDGLIGDLIGAQAYYLTGALWSAPRQPGMTDMEWQCRNWLYFTWLSGDHIVEQFVHNIDVMNWIFGGPPASALAMGGRIVRVGPEYGHIYDHFSVEYDYAGARVEAKCRQMDQALVQVTNRVIGTAGVAELHPDRSLIRSHAGEILFRFSEREVNPYVQEHADLVASIRGGSPVNEAKQIAESTLAAIMGRESAYTGQHLTREAVASAAQRLAPESIAFGDLPVAPVPAPGRTRLERNSAAVSAAEGW